MQKLSYTSSKTYMECSQKYKLHYLDKLRPEKVSSYLFYGSKLESGIDVMLLKKKKNLSTEELKIVELCPKKVFDDSFSTVSINGHEIDPRYSDLVEYAKSDYDVDILTKEDQDLIESGINQHWVSLRRKAHLILDEYAKVVIPEIEEVLEIQKKIELPDSEGNIITGYVDFIAKFTDGKTYIVDNKTSSRIYPENAVELSEQFATYSEYCQIENCCYIVMEKKIRKRDPQVRIQILKDLVPETTKQVVFSNYNKVLDGIKKEDYTKNYESGCFSFGKPCPYYAYCRSEGKDTKGLIFLKEGNENDKKHVDAKK